MWYSTDGRSRRRLAPRAVALGSRENPRTQAATAVEPEPEPEPPQVEPTPSAPVPVSQRNGGDRGSRYSNENRPSVPVSAAAQAANERNNAANIAGSAVLAASDPVYTPATSYSGGGGNAAPVGGRQQPQNGNGGVTGVGGLLDVSDPVVSVGGSTIGGGPDAMAGVRLGIGRDAVGGGGGGNNNANHGGRPTGAGDEPWSMNSFEDLLNGLVGDEPEVEEAEMPMNSRFARFFADPNDQPYNPHQPEGVVPATAILTARCLRHSTTTTFTAARRMAARPLSPASAALRSTIPLATRASLRPLHRMTGRSNPTSARSSRMSTSRSRRLATMVRVLEVVRCSRVARCRSSSQTAA